MTHKAQGTSRSASHSKLATAYRAIYAVAALSIFLGLLATLFSDKAPGGITLAILFFAFGALYLLLGFFVQRKSTIALGIAVALMALNALTGLYNLLQTGSITGLIVPAVFLNQTWQGFKAIQELK